MHLHSDLAGAIYILRVDEISIRFQMVKVSQIVKVMLLRQ